MASTLITVPRLAIKVTAPAIAPRSTKDFSCVEILAKRSWSIFGFETFCFWAVTGGKNMSKASAPIISFFQKLILGMFQFSLRDKMDGECQTS